MNVWMKRGLQTALFTGGLLAAGTGLASADDSTLDVTAPVTVTDNTLAVLGTAPDDGPTEIDLPALDGTVGVDAGDAAVAVPITIGGNRADAAGVDVGQPSAAPASGASPGSGVDADVPVTVTGNAVGVLGDATAGGTAPSAQPGADDGGAAMVDADAPVLVCGNGVGVLGEAAATCTAPAGADAPAGPAGEIPPMSDPLGSAAGDVVRGSSPRSLSGADGTGGNAPGRTGSSDSSLAYTGSSVALPLLWGLLAAVAGLGLTVLGRRRRGALG